jgi:predicted ATPase/DNA-binding XRE family transcriptional regulator
MSLDSSFGDWIRRRRKSLDLTQANLAQRVGCALITIKKIEQDERRPSRQMAERLADCLGVQNSEWPAFIKAALAQLSPDRLPPPATKLPISKTITNLPQPTTRLIGRRKEIAQAVWLLRHQARLLTITGTGGVGKTRLAQAVAQQVQDEFRDGAVFISLASLQEPGLVPARIAQELKLKESGDRPVQELLFDFLASQEMLLLLDNFEHLLLAAPLLAELLSTAPGLRLLVTSRAHLHLSCETVLTVQPLGLPDLSSNLSESQIYTRIARSQAVRLFVNRARANYPAFRLSRENSQQLAEICQRLDGLPLALELAASRVREYPLALLQEGLSRRLDLLSDGFHDLPTRQRTLRNTFDWSFNHLRPEAKDLFPRLGVFSGGFDFDAVLAIRSNHPRNTLLVAIGNLTESNMIFRLGEGERYDLLETAHEYALERLESTGQTKQVRRAHLAYFTQLVEEAAPHLWDRTQGEWLRRLTVEVDNLRGALRWALNRETAETQEVNLGARMAASLWYFWYLFGAVREGGSWLAAALDRTPHSSQMRARLHLADGALAWQQGKLPNADSRLRESIDLFRLFEDLPNLAEATHMYGHVVFDQQDYQGAESLFKEALSIYESLEDSVLRIALISDLGLVAYHRHDFATARRYYEQSLALFLDKGMRDGEAASYIRLGDLARLEGDYQKAEDFYEMSLQINRELEIRIEIACALHKLGFTALRRGEIVLAQALFRESPALQHDLGNQQGIAECLAGLASTKVYCEEYWDAARYFGAARQILSKTGLPLAPADLAEWQADEQAARAKCDPMSLEQAWSIGLEEAVDRLVASLLAVGKL